ncbi:MAG: cytidine deaminase [Lachnospiraceae bacterium]|nr:cytidine deaminase [Lachnospiraceae bacterium]
MSLKLLEEKAREMQKLSYAPYSGFNVGAALLSKDGRIFTGCNVENAAYSPGCCAERVALFKAVSEGVREFEAIAIAGGKNKNALEYCPPCGVCRQVLREFVRDDFLVILIKDGEESKVLTFGELFPESFGPENL